MDTETKIKYRLRPFDKPSILEYEVVGRKAKFGVVGYKERKYRVLSIYGKYRYVFLIFH